MPYTAAPAVSPDRLLETAAARWTAVLEARPELEPAVDLQRRLIGAVVELTALVEQSRMPKLSMPPGYVAAKLARGVPALAGEPIPLPARMLQPHLLRMCGALASGGAGETAAHIQTAIESGNIDTGSLLAASLARDQEAIRQGAIHRGLAPDLVWLIAELAISPVAHVLQRALFGDVMHAELGAALDGWVHGYCPACGSWPAIAEVPGGHRTLRCSFCAAAWELRTYACIYCAESGEAFVTAAPDEERKSRRVEVCGTCAGYLKTVDTTELSPFPLIAIADLETMDLDVAAMERGYRRPPAKSFTAHQRG